MMSWAITGSQQNAYLAWVRYHFPENERHFLNGRFFVAEDDPRFPEFLVKTELEEDDDTAESEPIKNVQVWSIKYRDDMNLVTDFCFWNGSHATSSVVQWLHPWLI